MLHAGKGGKNHRAPTTKGAWPGKPARGKTAAPGKKVATLASNGMKGAKCLVQPSPQARISTLSAQLGAEVDSVANGLMDVNADEYLIREHLERIFRVRNDLALAMQHAQPRAQAVKAYDWGGKGGLKGGKAKDEGKTKAPKRPAEPNGLINLHWAHAKRINWKGLLQEWIVSQINRTVTRHDMIFEITDELNGDGKREYFGKLTVMCLEDDSGASLEYSSIEPAMNAQDAEQLAAKLALFSVRPDQHAEAERQHQLFCEGIIEKYEAPAPKKAKKATTSSGGSGNFADEKSRLNNGAQMLLGRAIRKEDVKYDVTHVKGSVPPVYRAAVALPHFDPDNWYEGEPCNDIKLAEDSAAAKFLELFADEIAEKKMERDAKVEQKQLEREARHAARMEELAEEEHDQNPYL